MRWQPLWRLSFSLSCALLTTTLIPAGRAPALATKLEQQEQELEQRRTQGAWQRFEVLNACGDRFYNSFYWRRHICLSALQVDQLFRLFLPFILLVILITPENGTQELCISLYPTHLTNAFLFLLPLFITFTIQNIFCFAGESSYA